MKMFPTVADVASNAKFDVNCLCVMHAAQDVIYIYSLNSTI